MIIYSYSCHLKACHLPQTSETIVNRGLGLKKGLQIDIFYHVNYNEDKRGFDAPLTLDYNYTVRRIIYILAGTASNR